MLAVCRPIVPGLQAGREGGPVPADCQLGIPEQQALADEAELLWKKEKVVDYIVTQKF